MTQNLYTIMTIKGNNTRVGNNHRTKSPKVLCYCTKKGKYETLAS
jgi:hypothetical protein